MPARSAGPIRPSHARYDTTKTTGLIDPSVPHEKITCRYIELRQRYPAALSCSARVSDPDPVTRLVQLERSFSVTNQSQRVTRCSDRDSAVLRFEQHVASAHEHIHTLPFASRMHAAILRTGKPDAFK